ncbi:MAG: leucine-rich repeat domain-containing protein [Oscillospiraceae bacterium]|nr:leucine-rich repeat domain-containing protein [Oscillospiraceae bacterium]
MKPARSVLTFVLIFVLLLTTSGLTAMADSVLKMPADLEIIEEDAFYGSSSIDKVVLSDKVKEIRAGAFANSTLSEINLPESITFIDETAFDGCSSVIARTYPGSYAEGYAKEHENLENHTAPTTIYTETTVNADGSISTKKLETWTETTVNADGSVTVTDYVKETVTTESENGVVETVTEKTETTVSAVYEDGTVTDTTTVSSIETVTETVSDVNGNWLHTTETKTEGEKYTYKLSAEIEDGTVKREIAETTETEKVTEKITDADGNVTETVTKTTREEFVNLTLYDDGSTGGYSGATTTVTDGDDNVLYETDFQAHIEGIRDENGTIITTTTTTATTIDASGNVSEETTITTENKTPDGSTGVIVADEDGNVLSAETTISQEEFDLAMEEDRPIQAPLTVDPASLSSDGELPPIKVTLPPAFYDKDGDGVVSPGERPKVEIQVSVSGAGVIVAEVGPDGTLRIEKDCYEG